MSASETSDGQDTQCLDLTGQRFSKLVVIESSIKRKRGRNRTHWKCICDCGNIKEVEGTDLKRGNVKSCGCLRNRCSELHKGERFGMLTVLAKSDKRHRRSVLWECVCDCGEIVFRKSYSLKSGRSDNCGCYSRKKAVETLGPLAGNPSHGHAAGETPSSTYNAWRGLKGRCNNPKNSDYSDYGGRGITVCAQWNDSDSFEKFLEDMGERPDWATGGLDRIDVDGNYEPGNCRWATKEQQAQNKRSKGSSDL